MNGMASKTLWLATDFIRSCPLLNKFQDFTNKTWTLKCRNGINSSHKNGQSPQKLWPALRILPIISFLCSREKTSLSFSFFLPSLGRLVVITLLLSEGELVNSFLVVLSRERQKLKKLNHYHFRTSKICTAGSIHLMGIPVAALNLIL